MNEQNRRVLVTAGQPVATVLPHAGRMPLAFCAGCGDLCVEIPRFGWRHLVVEHAPATAAWPSHPYVAVQTDGAGCDPFKAATRRAEVAS